ncbi:fluoride efflux transporter FluC [Arthrobacter sp. CAL618]|uniref:fluoride efflux transporter FluC n=1 Tax=Arthrobacter sp. CAL618 TaxID=1055770 RepID=UPI000424D1A4|nr:CrcB family protein [Arthrobacter sp. CAL618]
MNTTVLVIAALSGGMGAALRFVVDASISQRFGKNYPWATNVINASGSLVLGLLTGLASNGAHYTPLLSILGVGLIGGYTTFSTASVETVRLLMAHRIAAAGANAFGSTGLCILLALTGLWLGALA